MSTDALRQALTLNSLIASPYRAQLRKAVTRWTKNSGFNWCADRCKSVVAYLLKIRAGEDPARPMWISDKYLTYAENIARLGSWDKNLSNLLMSGGYLQLCRCKLPLQQRNK
jgi:hypothetical protein